MPPLVTDPIDWELDDSNDLIIPLRYVRGLKAIVQRIRIRLLMWRGEWFLNLSAGVPYLPTEDGSVTEQDAILGQAFDEVKTRAAIREQILAVDGVLDVTELRVTFDGPTRTLSIRWRASTIFGDTESQLTNLAA